MMKQHHSADESRQSFLDEFYEAVKCDKWLAVVWTDADDGGLTLRKTSNAFNMGKYTEALLQLRDILNEEIRITLESPMDREPLPLAPHLAMVEEEFNNASRGIKKEGVVFEDCSVQDAEKKEYNTKHYEEEIAREIADEEMNMPRNSPPPSNEEEKKNNEENV